MTRTLTKILCLCALSNFFFYNEVYTQIQFIHGHGTSAGSGYNTNRYSFENPALMVLDTVSLYSCAIVPNPLTLWEYSSLLLGFGANYTKDWRYDITCEGISSQQFSDLLCSISASWKDQESTVLAGISLKTEFVSFDNPLYCKALAYSLGARVQIQPNIMCGMMFSGPLWNSSYHPVGMDFTNVKAAFGIGLTHIGPCSIDCDIVTLNSNTGYIVAVSAPVFDEIYSRLSFSSITQSIQCGITLPNDEWTYTTNFLYHSSLGMQYSVGIVYSPMNIGAALYGKTKDTI